MRYFKVKEIVTGNTTLSIVVPPDQPCHFYFEKAGYKYFGTSDLNLDAQHKECEVTEVTFAEIETDLKSCRLYKDVNNIVRAIIAQKYDVQEEISLSNKGLEKKDDTEYVSYRAHVNNARSIGDAKKKELGLKQ